ncbi:DUF924 family protein [Cedecea colo]|uniref:DUF924 domain-containing protein n=1 Tax=Cedecea colo TaxID=2552946 RepID=A0ABX0VHY5_9ENTR|nr:DUF924 family protein [Cedecea colo]NIY46366.1 DUF924 domain-containing protein [Cedecea colo]
MMKPEIAKEYAGVLEFWFKETPAERWFNSDKILDEQIRSRFSAVHHAATRGELFSWRESLSGRLAEIIVLDQFSRNLFREGPLAWAADGMALVLAQELIKTAGFSELAVERRDFAIMPFMHSESAAIHNVALKMFQQFGSKQAFKSELQHKQIIEKFGRYPHRNTALGRTSTAEELLYLQKQKKRAF